VTACAGQMPARIMYINGFKGLRQFLDLKVRPVLPRRTDSGRT
jgi:hypothetical protein